MNTDKYTLEELEDLLKDNPKLPQEARTVIEKAIAIKKNKTQEVDFSKKIMIGKGSEHYVISVGMSGVDKGYKVGDKVILQDDITAKDMSEGVKGDSKFIVVRTGKEVGIPLSWVSRDKPKAKTTTKKTAKKPRAKVSPEEKAEKQKKLADATGKSLDECKEILAKYEALRGKTTAKDKERLDKLDEEGKLIEGTNTKTAEATTESTAKSVPAKIKKEVSAIEKEAKEEATKEVKTTGKTKAEVNKEIKEKTEEKIEKKVEGMTSDLADAGAKFIKSVQSEIAKFSKDDAKKFLLDIKTQVELLLRAYGHGGQLEGITQEYAIAWAGGDRPSTYAKGGNIDDLEIIDNEAYRELDLIDDWEVIEEKKHPSVRQNISYTLSKSGDSYRNAIKSNGEFIYPVYFTDKQMAINYFDNRFKSMFAKGGKTTHAINQDRRRLSQEPWEQAYLPKRKGDYYEEGGFIPNAIYTQGGDQENVMILKESPNGYFEIINKAGDVKNVHNTYVRTLSNYEKSEGIKVGDLVEPIDAYKPFSLMSEGIVKRIFSDKIEVEDSRGNLSFGKVLGWQKKKFAKGGRTRIVNEGVDFTEKMYRGIMGDKDNDGIENADDVAPDDASIDKQIEQVKFTDTFRKLLDNKKKYDDSMYSVVSEMEKMFPDNFDIIARTKTPFSILKKLVEKRLEGSKGLTDVIGTTVTVNNNKELQEVARMIGNGVGAKGIFGEVLDFDDFFASPNCGYMAYHYIVDYKGTPVEIQVKTKRMKKLNEFSHQFYKSGNLDCKGMGELSEIVRKADDGDKQAQKEFADIYADKELMESMISY